MFRIVHSFLDNPESGILYNTTASFLDETSARIFVSTIDEMVARGIKFKYKDSQHERMVHTLNSGFNLQARGTKIFIRGTKGHLVSDIDTYYSSCIVINNLRYRLELRFDRGRLCMIVRNLVTDTELGKLWLLGTSSEDFSLSYMTIFILSSEIFYSLVFVRVCLRITMVEFLYGTLILRANGEFVLFKLYSSMRLFTFINSSHDYLLSSNGTDFIGDQKILAKLQTLRVDI